MLQIMKQVLSAWDTEKNQRLKLQKAYFFVAILLTVVAGLVTLLSPLLGTNLIVIAAFVAAVYLVNAVSWTVVDLIVSKKVSGITKPATTKKR